MQHLKRAFTKRIWVFGLVWGFLALCLGQMALAQPQNLTALARFDAGSSQIRHEGEDVLIDLGISQPVPWRVRLLDNPARLVLDMREVDWRGIEVLQASYPLGLRAGAFRAGWSRFVLELAGPMRVVVADMRNDGHQSQIMIKLQPSSAVEFMREAAKPEPEEWALPPVAQIAPLITRQDGPLMVVLDPGHGGIDPGAERGEFKESDLMLTFARELKELLLRDGQFEVVLTRDDDIFVPLEERISIARHAGAGVFISLHADTVVEGEAHGATIYTLADEATAVAVSTLSERHERGDLLAGVDLTGQEDVVAHILMSMAQVENQPRTERLAMMMEQHIKAAKLPMHRHARQTSGFSVLKSPDIPSVLLELGFMSSLKDLTRLQDRAWRDQFAEAVLVALRAWKAEDETLRALR